MQRLQEVFLVSGFPIRVILRNDPRFSFGMTSERTCLDLPHFVPYNTVGEIADASIEDIVTMQISISRDCLPQQPQNVWEEYLTLNSVWDKKEFDTMIGYIYEIEYGLWKASVDHFLNQIEPSQCVSYDHVVQITSDLSLEELSHFGSTRAMDDCGDVKEDHPAPIAMNEETTFVAFLEKQEQKRCKRRTSKATQRAMFRRFSDQQEVLTTAAGVPAVVAAAASPTMTISSLSLDEIGSTSDATVVVSSRGKKKKKSKAARRVRRNVSSQLPIRMQRMDSDLIMARGVYRRGLDCAQRVLDVFKQKLMPIDNDNTFSGFVPWFCNCRCGNVVTCGDLGGTTQLIYQEIMACLMTGHAFTQPIQTIQCCRIDYYGGRGEVPVKPNKEALIGYGQQPVTVITLSLLSPRNCVIASEANDDDRHSFHVRNGDIMIQNGLFLKHFRCGFEQNQDRLDSHTAPRLSLTFMPILHHNCEMMNQPLVYQQQW